MTMTNFIFRFPADVPPMTFEALAARLRAVCNLDRCSSCYDTIGTTVQVRWNSRDHSAVLIRLYETTIAILGKDGSIQFPNDDPHKATTEWISKIVRDNGLGSGVCRIRRRKSDGPGPDVALGQAGLLVIDGDRSKPVHGRAWTVDRERIARNLDWAEEWAASMAFRAQHPGQWDADLAAAVPGGGTPDYRDRVDPALWRGTRHQPSLTDIR
jgi:hypothetical protein